MVCTAFPLEISCPHILSDLNAKTGGTPGLQRVGAQRSSMISFILFSMTGSTPGLQRVVCWARRSESLLHFLEADALQNVLQTQASEGPLQLQQSRQYPQSCCTHGEVAEGTSRGSCEIAHILCNSQPPPHLEACNYPDSKSADIDR